MEIDLTETLKKGDNEQPTHKYVTHIITTHPTTAHSETEDSTLDTVLNDNIGVDHPPPPPLKSYVLTCTNANTSNINRTTTTPGHLSTIDNAPTIRKYKRKTMASTMPPSTTH